MSFTSRSVAIVGQEGGGEDFQDYREEKERI
jgi:hypothetical protein